MDDPSVVQRYEMARAALQVCPAIGSMQRANKVVDAVVNAYKQHIPLAVHAAAAFADPRSKP